MRKLLLLPVTLPVAAARGALTGVLEAVSAALEDATPAPAGLAPVAANAPVTPLRPRPKPPPPPAPPPADDPPPAAAEVFGPPEPTRGEAARAREALREAGSTDDSPGAEIRIGEPWPGYSKLRAPDIVDRLQGSDAATKAVVRLFESGHRKRRTVLAATE